MLITYARARYVSLAILAALRAPWALGRVAAVQVKALELPSFAREGRVGIVQPRCTVARRVSGGLV